jgi:hypothetical protein
VSFNERTIESTELCGAHSWVAGFFQSATSNGNVMTLERIHFQVVTLTRKEISHAYVQIYST